MYFVLWGIINQVAKIEKTCHGPGLGLVVKQRDSGEGKDLSLPIKEKVHLQHAP
jgi:hypothetical protein